MEEKNISTFNELEEKLFSNDNFITILENFTAERWNKLDSFQKASIFGKIDEAVCETLNIKKRIINIDEDDEDNFMHLDDEIAISQKFFEKTKSPFSALNEYFKSVRHLYQDQVIFDQNGPQIVGQETFNLWELNNVCSVLDTKLDCYLPKDHPLYNYQPLILDARNFADKMVFATAKKMRDSFEMDILMESYLMYNKFILNTINSPQKEMEAQELIIERGALIKKEAATTAKLIRLVTTTDSKSLPNEVIYSFLHPSLSNLLTDNLKKIVLTEFVSRELSKYNLDPVNVDKEFEKSNGQLVLAAISLIHRSIAKNIDKISPYFKDQKEYEHLKINLYKNAEGKKINLIDEQSCEGRAQPFSQFKRNNARIYLSNINNSLAKIYGVDQKYISNTNFFIIDDQKLKDTLEKYYDIPFDKFYEKMVFSMAMKIEKDVQEKNERNR